MKLYLVTSKEETDWDQHDGFVVRAKGPEDARRLAAERADEPGRWDKGVAIVKAIPIDGPRTVILRDFHAG